MNIFIHLQYNGQAVFLTKIHCNLLDTGSHIVLECPIVFGAVQLNYQQYSRKQDNVSIQKNQYWNGADHTQTSRAFSRCTSVNI